MESNLEGRVCPLVPSDADDLDINEGSGIEERAEKDLLDQVKQTVGKIKEELGMVTTAL